MLRLLPLVFALTGCGGIAWNTTVAETPSVRQAMVASIVIGQTTEKALITRWGRPTQKIHEGGQVEYIYRDMRDAQEGKLYSLGDSSNFVIVTFQYGRAIAVRTTEDERCRATFAPRPPSYVGDNPNTVHPIPGCDGLYRPQVGTGGGVPASGSPPILSEDPFSGGKLG